MGNAALGTPNLDRFAKEGVCFDRAYTASPVCGPARSAIFTGLPSHANGMLGNHLASLLGSPSVAQRLAPTGVVCAGHIGAAGPGAIWAEQTDRPAYPKP